MRVQSESSSLWSGWEVNASVNLFFMWEVNASVHLLFFISINECFCKFIFPLGEVNDSLNLLFMISWEVSNSINLLVAGKYLTEGQR